MTVLAILTAIFNSLWQAAALAGLVWLALKSVRMNAATRCVIWWSVLIMLPVLPWAPRLGTWFHQMHVTSAAAYPVESAPVAFSRALGVDEPAAIMTLAETPAAKWPFAILMAWAAVLVYGFARIGRSYLHLREIKQHAASSDLPLTDVGRRVRVLVSRRITSPMAVGFLRPAVMLPEDLLARIPRGELDQILLHEAAHLARWDDWTNLVARVLGAVLAFHPVARWILRQIEYEREAACDDWVVARTGAVMPYAESLAHMVEMRWQFHASRNAEALASGVFGHGSRIGDRIEMLLQNKRHFSARVSFSRVVVCVFALCCVAAAGSVVPRWIAFANGPVAQRVDAPAPVTVPSAQIKSAPRPVLVAQVTASTPAPQTRVPRKLAFEVASIKVRQGAPQWRFAISGTRLTIESYTLFALVKEAYNLRNYQIQLVGVPPLMAADDVLFDISAKAEGDGNPTRDEFREMLRSLLVDRFHVKAHREMKEMPVYALVVGKNGPRFKESAPDEPPVNNHGVNGRNQTVTLSQGTMESLAGFIGNGLLGDRPVLDKTGLKGAYDIKLEATAEARINNNNPQPEDISVFDAVQQQLGLRLESQKADIEVFVVDHIEKPSEN